MPVSVTPLRLRPIRPLRAIVSSLLVALVAAPGAAAQDVYRLPPPEVVEILDAPQAPFVSVDPEREWLLLAHRRNMPTIADMSEPMLRLAGTRINPRTTGRFGPSWITGFSVMPVSGGEERRIEVPGEEGWDFPSFAPTGSRFAVERTTDEGIELWVGDVADGSFRRLVGPRLNGTGGGACDWMPDARSLLCRLVPGDRGAPPEESRVPTGPVIQESAGRDAPVRTYQDLLEHPHDEALFDHYMTSVPALVDVETGRTTALGDPGVYADVTPSPDGRYLLVERLRRPYSYLVPWYSFPTEVEVWDEGGEVVRRLHDLPLQEEIPIGGVSDDPRGHRWVAGEAHTLLWIDALDGGDSRAEAEVRDRVFLLDAPFRGDGRRWMDTELRFSGLSRTEEGVTFVSTFHRPSRATRTWIADLDVEGGEPRLVWDRNYEDRYSDPGNPLQAPSESGERLIVQEGDWIYLTGSGASDEGDRPFLDRMDLRSLETERLWRSGSDEYEVVVALLDDAAGRILTRRESIDDPPNYFVRDLRSGERTALTDFPHPHPQLAGVEKRFVTYEREDGVQLSGDVYLPPDYREGERRPAVIWAYPLDYTDARIASQVRGSPNRFTRIGGPSHLFFLTQGYVVFDGPAMPLVGGDDANETFREQLVMDARAAVRQLDEMGVADPDRIGVGGHSYGAFMTGNLLAHSDLFRAGIARSGAYNRTLTPFGFQTEQRTFWEAPELYFEMSPFMHAHRIDEPLLMIHGADDNNSGTFPVQSERMYHAVKGLGGTVRLVVLPSESHGYRARESVLHTLAEMIEWFDRWVKNAGGATPVAEEAGAETAGAGS